MKTTYSATQIVHETVSIQHDAVLAMMIDYLQDMVGRATHITEDGQLVRTEDVGRYNTRYEDTFLRRATDEDRAIMALLPFLLHRSKK